MLDFLQYSFVLRGLEAGIAIALVAPLIGIFLVLRRFSLIADTLSHVSFAGVALGLLVGINPILTAIGASALSSVAIERLRSSKKVYSDSALSLFLSGSLAVAILLISLNRTSSVNIENYLFGSLVTVTKTDLAIVVGAAVLVGVIILALYKELIFISFDEEAATVSGIPVRFINTTLIVLSAVTVAVSIPIVGILLISALVVVPVLTALQFRRSFATTLLLAEFISLASMVSGIIVSFYLGLSTGGTIVIIALMLFGLSLLTAKKH